MLGGRGRKSKSGMCSKCGAEERRPTLSKSRRDRRRAEGLCTQCGGRRDDKNFLTCSSCSNKNKIYQRKYNEQKRKPQAS